MLATSAFSRCCRGLQSWGPGLWALVAVMHVTLSAQSNCVWEAASDPLLSHYLCTTGDGSFVLIMRLLWGVCRLPRLRTIMQVTKFWCQILDISFQYPPTWHSHQGLSCNSDSIAVPLLFPFFLCLSPSTTRGAISFLIVRASLHLINVLTMLYNLLLEQPSTSASMEVIRPFLVCFLSVNKASSLHIKSICFHTTVLLYIFFKTVFWNSKQQSSGVQTGSALTWRKENAVDGRAAKGKGTRIPGARCAGYVRVHDIVLSTICMFDIFTIRKPFF